MTRDPTGHGENATILGFSVSLGLYLSSLVDDPNLQNMIVVATPVVLKYLTTLWSNWLGAPLASMVGAGAMKGARLGVILLALYLPLGCAGTTSDQCKGYAAITRMIALQLAEDIDPASAEGAALRKRWAAVGELAAQAGCDQWAEPVVE